MTTTSHLIFIRTRPGRYFALGTAHTYTVVKLGRARIALDVRKVETVAGAKVSGDLVAAGTYLAIREAQAVADVFEAFGEDYQLHEHGHRSRLTEANLRVWYPADDTIRPADVVSS